MPPVGQGVVCVWGDGDDPEWVGTARARGAWPPQAGGDDSWWSWGTGRGGTSFLVRENLALNSP